MGGKDLKDRDLGRKRSRSVLIDVYGIYSCKIKDGARLLEFDLLLTPNLRTEPI